MSFKSLVETREIPFLETNPSDAAAATCPNCARVPMAPQSPGVDSGR
ncbi:hypothetical protein NJ7G_1005 [Natrinema sp. J7-2]|nr:hypothetical protein NJ7G_1005 [Natrinema sp. J7-2]